jgi:hypothetical protein
MCECEIERAEGRAFYSDGKQRRKGLVSCWGRRLSNGLGPLFGLGPGHEMGSTGFLCGTSSIQLGPV